MASASEELYDATIRHQIQLLRYSKGQARAVADVLEASDREIVAKLQAELSEDARKRLESVLRTIRKMRQAAVESVDELLRRDMPELAASESAWEQRAITQSCPVVLDLHTVPASTLKALVDTPLINGIPLEGWLDTMEAGDISRIEQQLRLGVAQGETMDQLVQRLRGTRANGYKDGVLSITRRNAETIARTTVNHVSNSARQEVWNANDDIISGVRWVATLDGRTSSVCRGRDGHVYPMDSGPRPPAHPGCRSTTTPVLDGEAIVGNRPAVRDTRTRKTREVDFRAEAKAEANRDDKQGWKNMSVAQRNEAIKAKRDGWADENISQVPSNQTYDAWLRKQPKGFQEDVLGVEKSKLFRDGLTLDKFVDERGREYTISQLVARNNLD